MPSQEWIRVRSLLEGALELEGPARARFIEQVSAGDGSLRRELEGLLAQDALGGGLEPPEVERVARALAGGTPPVAERSWRATVAVASTLIAECHIYAARDTAAPSVERGVQLDAAEAQLELARTMLVEARDAGELPSGQPVEPERIEGLLEALASVRASIAGS